LTNIISGWPQTFEFFDLGNRAVAIIGPACRFLWAAMLPALMRLPGLPLFVGGHAARIDAFALLPLAQTIDTRGRDSYNSHAYLFNLN